jgi:hypothetical protein
MFARADRPEVNGAHSRLGCARAQWKRTIGDVSGAREELRAVIAALERRRGRRDVLDDLRRRVLLACQVA